MMRSKTLVLSLAMFLVFGANALVAQQRGRAVVPAGSAPQMGAPMDPAAGAFGPVVRCLRGLELTDAQKADIKALIEAEAPILQGLHQTVKADQEALQELLDGVAPEACAVGAAFLKVHGGREAIRTQLQTFRMKIEALLTTEQKLRLAGCLDAHGPRP